MQAPQLPACRCQRGSCDARKSGLMPTVLVVTRMQKQAEGVSLRPACSSCKIFVFS